MHALQRTICKAASCRGVGLHSGKAVQLTIRPAPINHGIRFIRTDLPDQPGVTAHFNRVVDTSLATVIGENGLIVSTIEHLMATFAGFSIDNVRVELDSYEVPVMDGSAGPFADMIKKAGIQLQEAPRHFLAVREPIELKLNGKFVGLYPHRNFKITCTIDFTHPLIGKQEYTVRLSDRRFKREIARARTFCFYHEVETMKRYGLAQGGSLENAIVIDDHRIINEDGLRYRDEFVRHKLLDCLGDFSLLGLPVMGHLVVYKSGHAFNHAFLEKFFNTKKSWETITLREVPAPSIPQPKALAI